MNEPKSTGVQETARGDARAAPSSRVSLVLYHRDGAKVVPLVQGTPVVIGREWPADAVIADPNLSRQHVRFTWAEDGVWVEDLGSTNGTRLDGQSISRSVFPPGSEVAVGAVVIALHMLAARDEALQGVEGHDRFLTRLEDEILRARTFSRSLAVLMVRASDGAPVRHWVERVRKLLRPVDVVGSYGPTSATVLLPELGLEPALKIARSIGELPGHPLVSGVGTFPECAASAEELIDVVRRSARSATPREPILQANPRDSVPPSAPDGPVIASPRMRELYETVRRLARSSIPVLIHGETGTGKEVVASAIHQGSPRGDKPLRCINCGAIPATLLESMLFGHERGAFTGADRVQKGIFEQADGGTVFLDEVGELSAAAQVALLRVLESKRLIRLGSTQELEVDVRIVAATHRDLEVMCEAETFRWDLLYRLNTMLLEVPPLRERADEIPALAERFLAEASQANDSTVRAIAPEALDLLRRYHWPGNVRELRNVIERAVVIASSDVITPLDLSDRVRGGASTSMSAAHPVSPSSPGIAAPGEEADFKDRVKNYEVDLIRDALRRTGGNQTEAARLLRMPIRTLAHKIQTYGIKKKYE